MMKHFIYIILLLLVGTIACGDPKGPDMGNTLNTNTVSVGPIDTTTREAVIDTTDLYYLPEDTGGTLQGFPVGTSAARLGYYIYKPSGYTDDGPDYPLIVSLHGAGESGDSSKNADALYELLGHGIPYLINSDQWDPKYPFVVAAPQVTSTELWPPGQIHNFIEYVIENYQVNTNRIYLTGYSLGGGGCWLYAGSIEDHHAAAIVPISASGLESLVDNLREVPIWAFHGQHDDLVDPFNNFGSVEMVRLINETDPPIRARLTVYPNLGHNAWKWTYNGTGMGMRYSYDKFDMNIYEWMLQYKKE